MAKPSDLFIPLIAVRFCELLPLQMLSWSATAERDTKDLHFGLGQTFEDNIRRKYLYVFSATGSLDYGITTSTPGWSSRSQSRWACQHMAPLAMDGINPKPSKAPNPDQVDMEIYIDHQGRMWPLTITDTADKPRHQRPHPMWGKRSPLNPDEEKARTEELAAKGIVGFEWLPLQLATKDGKPRRYYFLLSPFRLGPAGLKAAISDIGSDGLSMWFDPQLAAQQGKITGPDPEALKACGQTVIPVVDPYNYGGKIYSQLFERALDAYLRFVGDADKGKIPGVDTRHFNPVDNGGTIDDLYFMAGVLANLRSSKTIDDEIDPLAVDEVLGGYGWELQRNAASCEVAARFLGNWMSGPAHAILDRSAIEDFDDPADEFGPDDKAGVLIYWWHKLRLLPNTITGAVAARQVLSESPNTYDNPVRLLFRKFEQSGNKIDPQSNEGQAALQLSDIIPDLVFLSLLRFDEGDFKSATQLDPDKAEEKAQRVANIVNNLGFLDTELINSKELKKRAAAKDAKDIISTQAKNIMKGGLYFADASGKMTLIYLKGRLSKSQVGFQAEEIRNIKDYKSLNTLGKQLKEMTEKSEAEMSRLARGLEQATKDMNEWSARISGFKATSEADVMIVSQLKAAEARKAVLERQIAEARGKVALDQNFVNSTRGAKGAAGKTQQARVSHVAAQTRLRQSMAQMDQLGDEMREVERQIAEGTARRTAELAAKNKAALEALVKEASQSSAKFGAASMQAKAASDRLDVIRRQSAAIDDLNEQARGWAKTTKEDIPRGMMWVSCMSFGIELIFVGTTLGNRGSSTSDIAWAMGDFLKASADLGKDLLKVTGAASADWATATGATNFLKVRSTLTLSNASGLMAVLGVIGGGYNVVKYGAKGIDGFQMDDYSVMGGAALAVLGGVLGIVSAMGMAAVGLTASGVGVLGGILVAAGALIIYYTVDSEWEYFAEHSYFAKDAGNRNTRSTGKGEDHWLGKMSQPSGSFLTDGKWSVRAQREALVRLLSRYSISSLAGLNCTLHYKLPRGAPETSHHNHVIDVTFSTTCVIDFQSLPVGASLFVEIYAEHRWVAESGAALFEPEIKILYSRHLAPHEMNAGPETVRRTIDGTKVKTALVGRFAGNDHPGFICIMLEPVAFNATKRLTVVVKTELSIPDGSKIVGEHMIAEVLVSEAGYHEDETPLAPTFVEKFSGASDPGF